GGGGVGWDARRWGGEALLVDVEVGWISVDDLRRALLHQLDEPVGRLGELDVADPGPGAVLAAVPHARRRDDHAALAPHVDARSDLRLAVLDDTAVSGPLEVEVQ